jgi:cyclic pyranopterin phosphate synthase
MEFTHIDNHGNAVMVDVSAKSITERRAVAVGRIKMSEESFALVKKGAVKKGDVLAVAQIAGIMATKQTPALIPLCHSLNLSSCTAEFTMLAETNEIEARCSVKASGQTGAEMEALTGVSIALLTVYDMCKAIDKKMTIGGIRLAEKFGGKSGDFIND